MNFFAEAAHIDFETRSDIELKTQGLDRYCESPWTEPMCLGWAFDEEAVHQWSPFIPGYTSTQYLGMLLAHVESGGLIYAHNAQFEYQIWNRVCVPRYGWPALRLSQMRCTMAMAYALSLPGALDDALVAVGASERKDHEGKRITLQLAKPRGTDAKGAPIWWDDPDKFARMLTYNAQDVVSERGLMKYIAPLSPEEQLVWEMDQEINQQGIYFDRKAVASAAAMMKGEKDYHNDRMFDLTGGAVGTCQSHAALLKWVQSRGVNADSVDKDSVIHLLADAELPKEVRAVLDLRQESARSSTAKLRSMLDRAGSDDRLRFMLQYHGAGTGRWSGRGVQLHNFPRPQFKQNDVEWVVETLGANHIGPAYSGIEMMFGDPTRVIPSTLRAMLQAAPGHVLLGGDFSNIEGRCLALLAGEKWKLQAFRDFDAGKGPDIYRLTYSRSFNVPIEQVSEDGEDRQIGKVEELALGYQGWIGAFQSMAANYHVTVSDERAAEIAGAWRDAHPATRAYWPMLEEGALQACDNPGEKVHVQAPGSPIGVTFIKHGDFLYARLPSGRVLAYAYARVNINKRKYKQPDGTEKVVEKKAVEYMGWDGERKLWCWMWTYGGMWAENFTQALCRDFLTDGLLALHRQRYNIVLHVHDEGVIEVPESNPITPKEYADILMKPTREKYPDMPIACKGWRRKRYGK